MARVFRAPYASPKASTPKTDPEVELCGAGKVASILAACAFNRSRHKFFRDILSFPLEHRLVDNGMDNGKHCPPRKPRTESEMRLSIVVPCCVDLLINPKGIDKDTRNLPEMASSMLQDLWLSGTLNVRNIPFFEEFENSPDRARSSSSQRRSTGNRTVEISR